MTDAVPEKIEHKVTEARRALANAHYAMSSATCQATEVLLHNPTNMDDMWDYHYYRIKIAARSCDEARRAATNARDKLRDAMSEIDDWKERNR